MKELTHDFSWCGDDRRGQADHSQLVGLSLEIQTAQMFVAGQQQCAFEQRRFREDQPIVDFCFRDQPRTPQALADASGYSVLRFNHPMQMHIPLAGEVEGVLSAFSIREIISECGFVGQFLLDCGGHEELNRSKPSPDHKHRVRHIFASCGQVQQNVGIKGDEHRLAWVQFRCKNAWPRPEACDVQLRSACCSARVTLRLGASPRSLLSRPVSLVSCALSIRRHLPRRKVLVSSSGWDRGRVTVNRRGHEPIDGTDVAEVSLHPTSLKTIPVQTWFDQTGQFIILEGEKLRIQIWQAATDLPVTPAFQSHYATNDTDYLNIRFAKLAGAPQLPAPSSQLRFLAELLSGNRLDGTGGWQPLELGEIVERWNQLGSEAAINMRAPRTDDE